MIILGIDPGCTRAGCGIIDFDEKTQKAEYVFGEIIHTASKDKHKLLLELRNSLDAILKKYKPKVAGIERLYFNKNIKTAIDVSQAIGVFIVCIQDKNIPLYEFTPSAIKQGLTGYGSSDKKAIEIMVKRILHINDLKQPDDVYDALAIALIAGYSLKGIKI